MVTHLATVQLVLDLVGIFVFALSGGLVGARASLDIFGILVLAFVTALGGGVLRDLVLDTRVVGIMDWRLVGTALAGGLITFWSAHRVERFSRPILVLDALGLGVFSVSGALKAVALGATPVGALILGVVTAVGGGMVRDVLVGQVPSVLRRELYAVPALLGSLVVVVAGALGVLGQEVVVAGVALATGLRLVSRRRRWEAPRAREPHAPNGRPLRPRVLRLVRRRPARPHRPEPEAAGSAETAGRSVHSPSTRAEGAQQESA